MKLLARIRSWYDKFIGSYPTYASGVPNSPAIRSNIPLIKSGSNSSNWKEFAETHNKNLVTKKSKPTTNRLNEVVDTIKDNWDNPTPMRKPSAKKAGLVSKTLKVKPTVKKVAKKPVKKTVTVKPVTKTKPKAKAKTIVTSRRKK